MPTMTAPRASGLPHSLVSNDRRKSSSITNDKVSLLPPSPGIKPASAALLRALIQAVVFAANPSGFELRCTVKSEYSDGMRFLASS